MMPATQTDEIAAIRDSICESADRLVATLDGLTAAQLNWAPPAENANSVYAIAGHALSAQEGLILVRVFGQPPDPQARAGWGASGDSADNLLERWQALRPRLYETLSNATRADLDRETEHPRLGKFTGWQMLLLVNRHTAEHIGHVELTRDLAKAAGV
jgi:hypothetical protein